MKYYPRIPKVMHWQGEPMILSTTKEFKYLCSMRTDLRLYNLNKDFIGLEGWELEINHHGKLIGDL